MHTSTKVHHTSAVIWRMSMSSRFMSINHFPYLPIVTNPKNNPCIQTVIRIATEIESFVQCPLPTFSENFVQTNNDKNISSSAAVKVALLVISLSRAKGATTGGSGESGPSPPKKKNLDGPPQLFWWRVSLPLRNNLQCMKLGIPSVFCSVQ